MSEEELITKVLNGYPQITREELLELVKKEQEKAGGLLTGEAAVILVASNLGTSNKEKKGSWAEQGISDEEKRFAEVDAERRVTLENAQIVSANALIGIKNLLEELVGIYKNLDFGTPRTGTPSTPSTPSTPPVPPAPENVSDDRGVEDYYRNVLSGLLDQDELNRTTIHVEEDQVIIKTPYFGDPRKFGRVAGRLRDDHDAEYVSAGRDSHFVAPRP